MDEPSAIGGAGPEPAVNAALVRFFGPSVPFSCAPIAARKSARGVFKVSGNGQHYALRLSNLGYGTAAWQSEIDHARLAAEAGVGPRLHLVQPELALTLMDWIESSAVADALTPIVNSLVALHACPAQQPGLNMLDWLGEQAHEVLPRLPAGPVREALLEWDDLRASVQPLGPRVPCHQDPNPANICFSDGRAWLIDWESAGAGDPFFDLASVANWFLWDGPLLPWLLRQYLQRNASPLELTHARRCRAVHFVWLLIASLHDAGLIERPAAPTLSWRAYLLQPEIAKRWREPDTIGQRQATLAHEILSW